MKELERRVKTCRLIMKIQKDVEFSKRLGIYCKYETPTRSKEKENLKDERERFLEEHYTNRSDSLFSVPC